MNRSRSDRAALWFAALLVPACVIAVAVWFLSPAGRRWSASRASDAELIAKTVRDPSDVISLVELARRLETQGRPGEAMSEYQKATQADGQNAGAWASLARSAQKAGDSETARAAAIKVLEIASAHSDALREAGVVLSAVGDVNGARDALEKATQTNPRDAAAWDALAQVQTDRGSLRDALHAARRATDLEPTSGSYWLHRATAHRLSADRSGAEEAIARAAQLTPNHPDVLLEQGILRWESGRAAERATAETALRRAAELLRGARREPEAWRRLGQFYLSTGRLPEAQTALETCLRLSPGDSAAQFALSRTFILQGRRTEADALTRRFARHADFALTERQLKLRMKREPERADLPARLGDLYAEQGDDARARAAYLLSLKIKPNQPDVQRRLNGL